MGAIHPTRNKAFILYEWSAKYESCIANRNHRNTPKTVCYRYKCSIWQESHEIPPKNHVFLLIPNTTRSMSNGSAKRCVNRSTSRNSSILGEVGDSEVVVTPMGQGEYTYKYIYIYVYTHLYICTHNSIHIHVYVYWNIFDYLNKHISHHCKRTSSSKVRKSKGYVPFRRVCIHAHILGKITLAPSHSIVSSK